MRADARRNHERLVAAARTTFSAQGANASLDDIARSAGVGNATLYRHFPTRELLLEAVYRGQIEDIAAKAAELVASLPPMEAFVEWLREMAAHIITHRGLKALLAAAFGGERPGLNSWCHEVMLGAANSVLLQVQETGEVRSDVNAYQMLRLVNAIVLTSEQAGAGGEEADALLTLVIDGLRAR
jgi:AcrR family transcriptional regulator